MFHNENRRHAQTDKSEKSYIKKSSTHIIQSITECPKSKHKKSVKSQKKRKHYRFKRVPVDASNYVGPERLTKHVGFFTKGKISDSISRLEKTMTKEVRARAQQDLKQVLNLTNGGKNKFREKTNGDRNKFKEKHSLKHKNISKGSSVQSSSIKTPHYLYHKTGFASSSWKDKLQKSVGLTSVNSILDSVCEQPRKTSPIQGEVFIARKALLNKIHPCIKEVNSFIFPNSSNKSKVKDRLLQIKNQLKPAAIVPSEQNSVCSSIFLSPQISQSSSKHKNSQNAVYGDFELNPIFTGESMDHGDLANMFPPVNSFVEYSDDFMNDVESTYLPNSTYETDIQPSYATSSSIGVESGSVTLVRSSPTSSENTPSWKLRISPVKFVPENPPTPTIYFRHKMF